MKYTRLTALKAVFARLSFMGLAGAATGFCLSFLPSLLPRPWLFQGVVTGFGLAIGYGVGTTLSWGLRWFLEWEPPHKVKYWAWRILAVSGPATGLVYLVLSNRWQNQVRALVDEPPQTSRHAFRILFISLLTFFLVLYTARFIRFLSRKLINFIDRLLPRKVSVLLGVLATAYLLVTIFNGLLFATFVRTANRGYAKHNTETPKGAMQPNVVQRSGGPVSLVSWKSLGYQGRGFVGRGPTQTQLTQFSGTPALRPIRVYAGLDSAPSAEARAALVVKELERTQAFNRKVLVIANATGTGWLEPQAVDSLEYIYSGDTAIASMQYSYLPSWLSFLVDKENAKEAGQQLFNAVYGKWASLPENARPKLITYGLSLGSYAGQAAFSGANDLRYNTSGALFVGTPSDTELWNSISKSRDAGSEQIEPSYKKGAYIRFADNANDFNNAEDAWKTPRTLYLQHASDPVVWFDFNLILNKPDWLDEKRGADVSPSMQWYPFITFTQVALDQFLGTSVSNGHGHNYADKIVAAWAAVTQPEGWTEQQTTRLQRLVNTYPNE